MGLYSFFTRRLFTAVLFLLLIAVTSFAGAQDTTAARQEVNRAKADSIRKKERDPLKNIFYGGGLGLQFGTYTFVDVSPMVGYRFTEKFSAGAGVTYMYYRYKFTATDYFSTDIYGGRLFARHVVFKDLFAHGEYEVLNLEDRMKGRINVTSIFLGGGYRQWLGGRTFLNLLLLYNINHSLDSPYFSPLVVRGGITVG